MYVVIKHEVRDPATFWSIISEEMERLPAEMKLLQSLPDTYGAIEFSLWRTDSMDRLQRWLEEKLGLVSRSVLHPVHAENAFGLPRVNGHGTAS